MSSDFIERATAVTDSLRHLDKRRVVFGSSSHEYRFEPPLGMAQVEAFELAHGVSLPVPYRRFITELGNGGAGPYYGVLGLGLEAPQLLQPFPATQRFQLQDGDDEAAWDSAIPGAIPIAEYGCGIFMLLVVRGEAAGQVWVDARYETGISPFTDNQSTLLTFETWWLNVMEWHLDRFEKILALMEEGIAHEEIHRRLDPRAPQLYVDTTMLSLMDQDPTGTPRVYADKPWGGVCGLVEDHYSPWLRRHRRAVRWGLGRPARREVPQPRSHVWNNDPSMEQLPFIDEHRQRVDAPADVVWAALLEVLRREIGGSALFARVLGCDPAQGTAEFLGRPGDAVPGFRVAEAEPGRRLALRGRHRFANYALTFILDGDLLRAQTHAAFPGIHGRLYRAAVIGSGVHRLVTRRLLRQVARAT